MRSEVSRDLGQSTYVATQQRVSAESAALAIIVCAKDDKDVFDCDHEDERPNNDRQDPKQVLAARLIFECRRIHVERTGPDVAIDGTDGLVGEPKQEFAVKDLLVLEITGLLQTRVVIFCLFGSRHPFPGIASGVRRGRREGMAPGVRRGGREGMGNITHVVDSIFVGLAAVGPASQGALERSCVDAVVEWASIYCDVFGLVVGLGRVDVVREPDLGGHGEGRRMRVWLGREVNDAPNSPWTSGLRVLCGG